MPANRFLITTMRFGAVLGAGLLLAACNERPAPGDAASAGAMPGADVAAENALETTTGEAAPIPEGSNQAGAAPSQDAQDRADAAEEGVAPPAGTAPPTTDVREVRADPVSAPSKN